MHVYDNIRYINFVFVLIRTRCCGNFFLFLCLHLANIQVSVCGTTGPLIYIKVGCFKRGMNYKDVIMMGKLALRLCLTSYYVPVSLWSYYNGNLSFVTYSGVIVKLHSNKD